LIGRKVNASIVRRRLAQTVRLITRFPWNEAVRIGLTIFSYFARGAIALRETGCPKNSMRSFGEKGRTSANLVRAGLTGTVAIFVWPAAAHEVLFRWRHHYQRD
jgi:hypothetical protein